MNLPPPLDDLQSLAAQHRLEEVAARFGLHLELTEVGGRLPFAQLAHVHFHGDKLTPATLRAIVFPYGLATDETGVLVPWRSGRRSVESLEDWLLRFLGDLLIEDPAAFLKRPARAIHIPRDGSLPRSAGYLERFYGGDFLPREKKELVVDLARSQGPFMRSVDDDPLQIVDAASQIASLAAGFRPDAVQAALDEGRFDPFLVAAPPPDSHEAEGVLEALRARLRSIAPPGLEHVAFVNGGAEANEKALHIARIHGPGGHRVLAFEGSFHGRTLLSLWATYNPVKRVPYQIAGYEAAFLPLPVADDPYADPSMPDGWREAWAQREGPRHWDADDALLQAEVAALIALETEIKAGGALACIIEPYQCEGGDQAPTRRFFHGLRGLTRAWGLPLIFDEVQSGFGLSGDNIFWHQRYHLLDADGQPDGPDLVTGAKRAQVGYVVSRWPDPALTTSHAASVVRGICHLDLLQGSPSHADRARQRLAELEAKWGHIVSKPRVFGDAFAFDMPDAKTANHLIGQRFYRGYMVYIAGERTLRYRLNRGMRPEEVDAIFGVIDASLTALVDDAGGEGPDLLVRLSACEPAAWVAPRPVRPARAPALGLEAILADPTAATADRALRHHGPLGHMHRVRAAEELGLDPEAPPAEVRASLGGLDADKFFFHTGVSLDRYAADRLSTRIRPLTLALFDALAPAIDALEAEAYEPARQDSISYFRGLLQAEGALAFVAEDEQGVVGFTLGAPLELWPDLDGPRQDPHRGAGNTLYGADTTVAARAQGRGLGERLRVATIQAALRLKRPDGGPRYAFITGRNQVGGGDAMWRLNQRYGAYVVARYSGQYGSEAGMTRYYRLPIRRHDRRAFAPAPELHEHLEFGDGLALPTGLAHPELVRARDLGVFDEPALTKLTISNFITPGFARYAEYLRHIAPEGNRHLYFTSSPDELVDKSFRVLKHNRRAGRIAVGVEGGLLGTVTAVSRSLSGHGGDSAAGGFFGWPTVPHPSEGDTIAALWDLVDIHGADGIVGVFLESVQALTGRTLSPQAWAALVDFRAQTGIPLVVAEHTTAMGRNGRRFWWVDTVSGEADAVLWWAGGQIGHLFVSDAVYVDKPLTFISTWDGDELSAARLLRQLPLMELAPIAARGAALQQILADAGHADAPGLGLYRVLHLPGHAAMIHARLAWGRVRVRRHGDALLIAPPLTVSEDELARFSHALKEALAHG